LKFIVDTVYLIAVNILPVEDYLVSVISSEMSATSSPEFLKAHAVISRSWLLAQKEKSSVIHQSGEAYCTVTETPDEYCCWYDREDHKLFDVCADDHCQRYQGTTKAFTTTADAAVRSTFGEVLAYDGHICDARFSKCCGGVTEKFENNWEPIAHPYLTRVADRITAFSGNVSDLTREEEAEKWIRSVPPAFCNTDDRKALSQVLNDYDLETTAFFRWTVRYTQKQISDLLRRKTGWDFGEILDLIPVERGCSGRIKRLKVIGTKKTMTIGKELFIRKALSESHLYSSAFVVEKINIKERCQSQISNCQLPTVFILTGAGWGHGCGLCQIGAAVMGEEGYGYNEILAHYFQGAMLDKRY
jgi:SpoIID/LytB domain protein